ncbi:MAG: hypothetical protein IID18_02370 [Nitrospinae bacterium]|nr:hypothetical protein [Nitrospinota bacterium]
MISRFKIVGQLFRLLFAQALILCLGLTPVHASGVDAGELHRLLQPHLPRSLPNGKPPADSFTASIVLGGVKGPHHGEGEEPVVFSIPGFQSFGCEKCHKGEMLREKTADRLRKTLARLKTMQPDLKRVPLRQYIIQSWSDALLSPRQLAHATFDTIRISPAAILIDEKVYAGAMHLHESLHLAQKFVGPANELEAYGLNVRSDPRFLLLNFPYFEDVVKSFFMPDLSGILDDFFARPLKENLNVPQEVQWFLAPFDPDALARLQETIGKMAPLLSEVGRLNREHSRTAAYLSEQTGNPALLLEIAAARHLPLPDPNVSKEIWNRAFELFDQQIKKNDNTRLGYKVNRKKEALLFVQHQLKVSNRQSRMALYFHYLKKRFVGPGGKIVLRVEDKEDFASYIKTRMNGIRKMMAYEGLTEIEREGARKLIAGN